jgi:hypothetical protein
MAVPWLLALKVIPWGDVIEHAPKVLKGAQRLLDRQRQGNRVPEAAPVGAAPESGMTGRAGMDVLREQVAQLQAELQGQRADVQQLTEMTAELAQQNTRLVQAVDVLRWRTRWLGLACAVLALLGAVAWWGSLG